MPASRSARAMILAPRSCPSRPGLATTTRILRLDSGFRQPCRWSLAWMRRLPACRARPAAGSGGIVPAKTSYLAACGAAAPVRLERSLGELPAQHLLVELAHARLRDRLDEGELVRQPPLGDQRLEVLAQVLRRAGSRPPCSTTQASGRSVQRSSGLAITAASSTSGCAISAFSSSTEEIHSPPDLIRSLARSVICMKPARVDRGDVAGAQPAVVELVGAARDPRSSRDAIQGPRISTSPVDSPSHGTSPSSPIRRTSTSGTIRPVMRCGSAQCSSPSGVRRAGARPRRSGWSRSSPRPA